jgi:hypothetical protein
VVAGAAGAAGAAVVGAAVGVAVTSRILITVLVTAGVGAAERGAAVAEWLAAVGGATSVTVPGVAQAASPSSAAASEATAA